MQRLSIAELTNLIVQASWPRLHSPTSEHSLKECLLSRYRATVDGFPPRMYALILR